MEARAETQKCFCSFFGSKETFKICCRGLLTFMNWFNYLEIIFSQHIAVILKMLLSRNILRFCPKLELMSCSQYRFKSVKSMKQVDVDDLELQAHLGKFLITILKKGLVTLIADTHCAKVKTYIRSK